MGDQSVLGEATSAKSEVFPEELEGNDENLPPNDDMVFEEVDFGNQSKYRVNWLRKTHRLDENTIVEIIIHVPDDASNADATDNPPLFSITISVIERKVEISQKYTLVWKNTEFPKLKSLVDRLQVNNELDADTIRDDYADIFQESEDAESLNLSSLDLSEILWDVSLLSTNENTTKSDQQKDKSIKFKSKVKGSNEVRVKLLSSPVCKKKNISKTKVPTTPSANVAKQQIINIKIYNNVRNVCQISKTEESISLEKSNKSLSDQVEELQNNIKDDAVQRESGRVVQNELSANVTDRNEPEVLITKEESGPIPTKKADSSESGDSNEQSKRSAYNKYIIVSSVTPRDDDFDEDIRAINRAIQSEILNFNDVIYANNDNLRDRALYFDCKHLNRNRGVRKFAANIKKAIRMASGVVDNKPRYPSYHSADPHPIRPDDRAPYPHPRYSSYHSDDPHPIRPVDRAPYPQHRYGSSVNPLLRPEDMRRKQDGIATQPIEVSKEHETKKENGINDVFSQLSTLNKLVNVLVSSNLQRCRMMYPQSTASPSFFPLYSSAVS
ncbi:Hypothetical predicted protein [Paramuricea clavata]|uniref:Uncharacterized protein n=1 Tax=Paramuricea clavata TaxID=317549 RepID=A0A7D9HJM1_PARCT|nr:Hypothetical predicted protein [Paramuricea clavata]